IPRPPRSTPFPYTTLFRSRWAGLHRFIGEVAFHVPRQPDGGLVAPRAVLFQRLHDDPIQLPADRLTEFFRIGVAARGNGGQHVRSEEHTSELQSRSDLVCR